MQFIPISIFSSNYIWAIQSDKTNDVIAVDPGDGEALISYLRHNNKRLTAVLITHSHNDHIGGLSRLINQYGNILPIYGPKSYRIPLINHIVSESDKFQLFGRFSCEIMALPGHLPEHIAYLLKDKTTGLKHLFCGDILFSSGCGRVFIGSFEELKASLDRLKHLDKDTLVYCAHEYTVANCEFAQQFDTTNKALQDKLSKAKNLRNNNKATLPTSIACELKTNPFLRCDSASIRDSLSKITKKDYTDELSVFSDLRTLRNEFGL